MVIPRDVRWFLAFVGDTCAPSEAGHALFETGLDSHVCDQSFLNLRRVVTPIRCVVTILFGIMRWSIQTGIHAMPTQIHAMPIQNPVNWSPFKNKKCGT